MIFAGPLAQGVLDHQHCLRCLLLFSNRCFGPDLQWSGAEQRLEDLNAEGNLSCKIKTAARTSYPKDEPPNSYQAEFVAEVIWQSSANCREGRKSPSETRWQPRKVKQEPSETHWQPATPIQRSQNALDKNLSNLRCSTC